MGFAAHGLAALLGVLAAGPALAQTAIGDRPPNSARGDPARVDTARVDTARVDTGPIWTFRVENDKLTTLPLGSDKYYTSGLQIGWTSAPGAVPPALARLSAALWGDGTQRIGLSLGQQIFTPIDTSRVNPNPRDRPNAGYLAGTLSLLHDAGLRDGLDVRSTLALSSGVIGPGALGRQVQNGFHTLIGVSTNRGWRYQLGNEPAIELLGQRVWRVGLGTLGGLESDLLPSLTAGVGSVRDYVQGGVLLRVGRGLRQDFGPGRIGSGLDGGDAYQSADELGWYLFGGADGQAVARDAFLDGNLFSTSRYVAKKFLVGEMVAGVGVIWRGVRFSYTQTWRTEEFRGQKGGLFNFGSLAASARF